MECPIEKPIAIAKVNLGNQIEEISIYKNDDILYKARMFCHNFELPKECIEIIRANILKSLSEDDKGLVSNGNQPKTKKHTQASPLKVNISRSKTPEKLRIPKNALKELGISIGRNKSREKSLKPLKISPRLYENKQFLTEPNESSESESFTSTRVSTMINSLASGNKQKSTRRIPNFDNLLTQSTIPSISSFEEENSQRKKATSKDNNSSLLSFTKCLSSKEDSINCLQINTQRENSSQINSYQGIHTKKKSSSNQSGNISPLTFGQRSPLNTPTLPKSPSKSSIKTNTPKSKKNVSFTPSTPNKRYQSTSNKSITLNRSPHNNKATLCSEGVSELFHLLDSDCDGFIDPVNIDLSGIKYELLEKLERLLIEIDERQKPLNLLQFNKLLILAGMTRFVKDNFGNSNPNLTNFPSS